MPVWFWDGPKFRRVLHIIAPGFSGSQASLERAIRGWAKRQSRSYHFRIVSNGASQFDQERIEGIFPKNGQHRLTFHSMVHKSTTVLKEILNYIGQDPAHVAILTESDSGFVSSLATMIVPLLGALLAISFDLSDLLHTSLGPILRLF